VPRTQIAKKCAGCGKEYLTRKPLQKYCSYACAAKHRKPRPRMGRTVKCQSCGKDFYVRPGAKWQERYYCSLECWGKAKSKQVKLKCKTCGKTYYRAPSQVKHRGSNYCSNVCKHGGRKVIQKRSLDAIWAQIIKKRAGFKCEYCGKTEHLHAHHIFSRSRHSTRWDISNGICLCAGHHFLCNFSAHKAPLLFGEWLKEYRGAEYYDSLLEKARDVVKPDYEIVGKILKQILKNMPDLEQLRSDYNGT